MPKPRQAQKKKDGKIATPKPLCENEEVHKEPVVMFRIYERGENGSYPACGWRCRICNNTIYDKK